MPTKEIVVVGGPNGSGKTTFANEFRAERSYPYLSADLIASELCPDNPSSVAVNAGRTFLTRLKDHLKGPESFLIESTLSGRGLRAILEQARDGGFGITILFVYLDSAEACLARIQERVRSGGHNVPESDVRRRFPRSLKNFWHLYRLIADYWMLYYNSENGFQDVAIGAREIYAIRDEPSFRHFQKLIETVNG